MVFRSFRPQMNGIRQLSVTLENGIPCQQCRTAGAGTDTLNYPPRRSRSAAMKAARTGGVWAREG